MKISTYSGLLALCVGWAWTRAAAGSPRTDEALRIRIKELLQNTFTKDDKTSAAALAEVRQMFEKHGLPTIAEVGDELSYDFVVLASFEQPLEFEQQVLPKVREAVAQHDLAQDAATFYATRFRLEKAKELASKQPPQNPDLRDQIERLSNIDQAVRQKEGFDVKKMMETDRQNSAPVRAILDKFGVPTFTLVGPKAAGDFVTMIQHQPAQFRQEVLPKLKANVDAGQADPSYYVLVYDRSQRDLGKKQLYGSQLECKAGEALHEAPIEDPAHVNERRAELGIMRIELYERLTEEMNPQFCAAAAH